MATLIDNVIAAGSYVGTQCLQFVNDVTHGAGAGFGTAGDLEAYAQSHGLLHATPQLGDVAVWGSNVNQASSAGHAGIVTAISGGQVGVTSTNWPQGSGAQQYTIGGGNLTAPSGYISPNSIGGHNIIPGGVEGSISTPTAADIASATTGASTIVGTEATDLGTAVSRAQTAASGTPFGLGQLSGAATGFFSWAGQSSLKYSFALDVISIGMIVGGVVLLFRREVNQAMGTVTSAVGSVATPEAVIPARESAPKAPAPKPAPAPKASSNGNGHKSLDMSATAVMHRANAKAALGN